MVEVGSRVRAKGKPWYGSVISKTHGGWCLMAWDNPTPDSNTILKKVWHVDDLLSA